MASSPSPDGKQVAYAWYRYSHVEVRLIGLDGLGPRVLYRSEEGEYISTVLWSPNGKDILVVLKRGDSTKQIGMLSVADGSLRVLKTVSWVCSCGRCSTGPRSTPALLTG